MGENNHKLVIDFSNLLMQLNQKIPTIGFNDEGKAEAIFIETRELIKKHFGEEHSYYKDYLRLRRLKGSHTYQLKTLLPIVEVIANRAKADYLGENEKFQQRVLADINHAEKNDIRIPWRQLDKLERKYKPKESLITKLKDLFRKYSWFLFDAHKLKVAFLLILGMGLCSVPFFINAVPEWLGYVSGIVVAIIGILFTMNKK